MTDLEYRQHMAEMERYEWYIYRGGNRPIYLMLPEYHAERIKNGRAKKYQYSVELCSDHFGFVPDYQKDLNALVRVAEKLCDKLGEGWEWTIAFCYASFQHITEDDVDEVLVQISGDTTQEALWQACCKAIDYLEKQSRTKQECRK